MSSSSSRTASRTTSLSKSTSAHPSNGSAPTNNSHYDQNESSGNTNEFDSRPSVKKNVSQYEGIYRNARFIHAISSGLLGQPVLVQTTDRERYHGILDTISPSGDIILNISHRLNSNCHHQLHSSIAPMELLETIDTSTQTFEMQKRIIKSSSIVEILAMDMDLSGGNKCSLDDNPKLSQLEKERFSRMQHFFDGDDIDSEALEELGLTDDGKTGYDPEHMFSVNQQKFQTTTDYDESKYTNVPVPVLSEAERAEIERKALEIETGKMSEDIDEDDAGVKRPAENEANDSNANSKANRSYGNEVAHDNDYNPSHNRRGNEREQRGGGSNIHNRRGSAGNAGKPNHYNSTRSGGDQSNYNRSQQYNSRGNRHARYSESRPSYDGRKSPSQMPNEEPHRPQRMNSGNYSHGQMSGPTSPSASVPVRTIYPSNNRQTGNRNSPAPYAGSSSSRNNSISTTSPPTGNNKTNTAKSSRTNSQSATEDNDNVRPNRLSNNSNSVNRPSQLQGNVSSMPSSNSNLSTQDEQGLNQETINSTQPDSSASYAQSTGTITPNSTKSNSLNPEADEFVPVFTRDSNSRPESRGAATASPMSMTAFIPHPQAAAYHLSQQQQSQGQVSSSQVPPTNPPSAMVPPTHPPNQTAFYSAYYPASFAAMSPYLNPATQQISLGMMPTSMMQTTQPLPSNASNTGSSSGMTTPNSSVSAGPTYKSNVNPNQTNDHPSNTGASNVATKKAVVSVQRGEQANVSHPQHPLQPMSGASHMIYSAAPLRYYTPEYLTQQGNPQSMPVQQIPIYYQMNAAGLIQAGGAVGQPQNIMIPTANVTAGAPNSAGSSLYYAGIYPDPRFYYSATAGNPHWQLPRSPPQQQQQTSGEQSRNYPTGQNVSAQQQQQQQQQQTTSTGAPNNSTNTSRSASATGGNNPVNTAPSLATQYSVNGSLPTAYAYGATAWPPGAQQIPSPQATLPGQVNAAYNMMFDPSQQGVPTAVGLGAGAAYVHPAGYDPAAAAAAAAYYATQTQQQTSAQQNLDTVPAPTGNYPR